MIMKITPRVLEIVPGSIPVPAGHEITSFPVDMNASRAIVPAFFPCSRVNRKK
jgi:hypothetical protein